ncbi:MAG TPA: sugar transferase [Aeromicrobium sp.]|nr:sugar transferase [Aeromicrobium sp.]
MNRVVKMIGATDFLALALAAAIAMLTKFGFESEQRTWGPLELSYPQFGLIVAFIWWWMLALFETRDARILGEGVEEYRRIGRATAVTFGVIAVVSVIVKLDFSRGYIAVALPIGLVSLLGSRWAWRRWLRKRRAGGDFLTGVLVVGNELSAQRISAVFAADPGSGYRVVGRWDPDTFVRGNDVNPKSIHPGLHDAVAHNGATAVMITDPQSLGTQGVRSLSWELDGVEILVSPHFVDVSPERVALTYLSGEPVIRLDEPQFARAGGLAKTTFDRVIALLLIVVASPVLVAAAIAVKVSSPGPVLFGHQRVGKDGKPFTMWKFRSMRDGADQELKDLLLESGAADTPLFKIENDPRVTKVGRFLRRTSLDELPQFFNVLTGSMSLVGPRPQVPEEVSLYRGLESARLHVRPGITGMWQVSGRSNLEWDEAARLDLYYVENWSMLVDLVILWRTVGVVVRGDGAR